MEAAWAEADVIVEGTYELPYQEHAYLQPNPRQPCRTLTSKVG